MTKKRMVEWMKTPGFATAIDVLRFLAQRERKRLRKTKAEFYRDRHRGLESSANILIVACRNETGKATRALGTVRP